MAPQSKIPATDQKSRGPARFGAITYPALARWTGLRVHTIRTYAARGVFDPKDLEATLEWVNERRIRQGKPPIGLPLGRNVPAMSRPCPDSVELDT